MRTGITQDIATNVNPSSLYSVLVMTGSPYALLSLPSSPVLMATVYGETANHSLSSNISMNCFACPASLRRLLALIHPRFDSPLQCAWTPYQEQRVIIHAKCDLGGSIRVQFNQCTTHGLCVSIPHEQSNNDPSSYIISVIGISFTIQYLQRSTG